LNKAKPALLASEKAISELSKDDINELKKVNNPVPAVLLALECTLIYLGFTKLDWSTAQKALADMKFLDKLKSYDRNSVPDNIFNKVKGVYLMGVPPTSNDFFAKNLISKNTFCIGDMLFIKPNDLRFDTALTLKEDYDYTLQHLKKYGNCFRYQKFIFEFEHYKNKGGAVDYRTEQEEKKNIMILKSKWGDKVRLNKKRENEILI
jgi:hypothetical protein